MSLVLLILTRMNSNGPLDPVGQGEEYPIVGASAPHGFTRVQSGYGCERCGTVVPAMARWVAIHNQWHADLTSRLSRGGP
ncbi:hypothetical protein GCM10027517_11800 [Phycicoccus ginsengisoli]